MLVAPLLTDNVTASNFTSAQSCHRRAGLYDPMDTKEKDQNDKGNGWNYVTPWADGNGACGSHVDTTQDYSGSW